MKSPPVIRGALSRVVMVRAGHLLVSRMAYRLGMTGGIDLESTEARASQEWTLKCRERGMGSTPPQLRFVGRKRTPHAFVDSGQNEKERQDFGHVDDHTAS